jgi:hypothetical protein
VHGFKPVVLFCIVVSGSLSVAAQHQDSAPIPNQIVTAKRVFIANAGLDSKSTVAFRKAGDPNRPYNAFYADMKKWGRYEVVPSLSEADLVLELRFTAPLSGCQESDSYGPQLNLKILDAKTHFVLWAVNEQVDGAFRKSTWLNNVDDSISKLVSDLKDLNH